MNRNYFSNTSDKVGKSSYLNLHDWRFLFTERLELITKSNFFPRATVKGLQQYRGESTSKISAVAGQNFFFFGGGGNLAERAKSRGYGTFLCDYKELGLNADHTDFCGNIQLTEEIINHKAQPQGNSPLSTGFYY